MKSPPRASGDLRVSAFAFFVTLGSMAALAAVVGYVLPLVRGGVVGVARYGPLIAVGSIMVALAIARHHASSSDVGHSTGHRSSTVGVAVGGSVALVAALVGDITDLGRFGPLKTTVTLLAVVVIIASPRIAGLIDRFDLMGRAAALMTTPGTVSDLARPSASRPGRLEWVVLLGGLLALSVGLVYVLASGALGHDESVYALKARSWLEGTPSTGFGSYRPPGMAMIGWVVIHFSDSEVALRSVAMVLAIAAIMTLWLAGRTMLSPAAAWLGSSVFVVSASYLRRATEFLNDLTAAALLLAVVLVVWYQFERRPDGWWIVAAAPLGAAAFYVRYGSAPGLVIIAIVAGIIWFSALGRSWKQIAVTAITMGTLLIPHFVYSIGETGSAFGVFTSARTSVGGGGGGLADYVEWFPRHLAGSAGAALMIIALAYTVVVAYQSARARRWSTEARTAVFLSATAVLFTIVLGAFTHGEPRFVFMPLMALLLVGGQGVVTLVFSLKDGPRYVVLAAAAIVILGAFAIGVGRMHNVMEKITSRHGVAAEAGEILRDASDGGACSVRASLVPQITWYSRCATFNFTDGFPADPGASWMVLFTHGKAQPEGAALDAELAQTPGTPTAIVVDPHGRVGDGFIYEYRRSG